MSPKHEKRDFITKPQTLFIEIPYYWILPEEQMLIVQRWTVKHYLTILSASAGQMVRAQPFDAIEIRVGKLFGDVDEEQERRLRRTIDAAARSTRDHVACRFFSIVRRPD